MLGRRTYLWCVHLGCILASGTTSNEKENFHYSSIIPICYTCVQNLQGCAFYLSFMCTMWPFAPPCYYLIYVSTGNACFHGHTKGVTALTRGVMSLLQCLVNTLWGVMITRIWGVTTLTPMMGCQSRTVS